MKRQEGPGGGGYKEAPPAKRQMRRSRCCLKVLCPDSLVWNLMGPKGATKDALQTETGAKLIFSNKDDYYPGTRYRVLGIYADDERPVLGTLDRVMDRVVEKGGEEERSAGRGQPNPDYLGKEPGEYMIRLAISKVTSGELIGRGGQRIKDLRADTGTKVFIENETVSGHQMVRVIGRHEQINKALRQIVDVSQTHGDVEEFHAWANYLNFSETEPHFAASAPPPPAQLLRPPPREDAGGKGAARRLRGGRHRGGKGDGKEGGPDADPFATFGPEFDKPLEQATVDEMIDELSRAIDCMPADQSGTHTAACSYSISFEIPAHRFEAVKAEGCIPPAGSPFLSWRETIQAATGVEIDMEAEVGKDGDPDAGVCISVVGPLLGIYAAHAMVLQKVREFERQEEAAYDEHEDMSREELIEKIKDLQAQLADARKLGFVPT